MQNQMLGEMIADKKDGIATEAKAIAAIKPTLRAQLAEIDTMSKLVEAPKKQIDLDTKWIMQTPLNNSNNDNEDGPLRRWPRRPCRPRPHAAQ